MPRRHDATSHRDKLLVYADEGSFIGKRVANKLKNMITSEHVLIEEKFRTPYTIENHMRVIISGKDDQLIKANHYERSYLALDASPARQGDPAYWEQMHNWRDNGGLGAFRTIFDTRIVRGLSPCC